MRKYATVFMITLQDSLQYRFNFFTGWLVNLWTLVAPLALWAAVYRESVDLAYGFDTMAAYLLVVHLLYRVILANDLQFEVGRDIREGRLNQFLSRPLSYPVFCYVSLLARRCTALLALALPLAGLVAALHFLSAGITGLNLVGFCFAALLGAVLSFILYFLLGLTAFWMLECQALFVTLGTVLFFLAGGLFPLDIIAGGSFLTLLPFSWQLMFPVRVLLGVVSGQEVWLGFGVQVAWIIVSAGIATGVWRAGIKRYEAVGG